MAANCSFLKAGDARFLARNHSIIWREICGIQEAILDAIEDHEYDVIVNGGTPMTSTQSILSVSVTNGGAGYDVVSATATIDANGTDGVDAEVEPIVTGTTITGFSVLNGGSDYQPISATATVGGAGSDAVVTPIVNSAGVITAVIVNSAGTGYSIGDPIAFTHPSGVGAAAAVSIVNGSGGVLAVSVTNGGSGYGVARAIVTVSHPTGFGFQGVVQVEGGVVVGVSIQNGGALYAPVGPTAVITDATGSGAVLSVELDGDAVSAIDVVSGGFGYSDPTVVIRPAAYGTDDEDAIDDEATAEATVNANLYGTDPSAYNDVIIGQSDDRVIEDQIQYILDYFTALGYNIRVQTNPATNNTIQWQVIW